MSMPNAVMQLPPKTIKHKSERKKNNFNGSYRDPLSLILMREGVKVSAHQNGLELVLFKQYYTNEEKGDDGSLLHNHHVQPDHGNVSMVLCRYYVYGTMSMVLFPWYYVHGTMSMALSPWYYVLLLCL